MPSVSVWAQASAQALFGRQGMLCSDFTLRFDCTSYVSRCAIIPHCLTSSVPYVHVLLSVVALARGGPTTCRGEEVRLAIPRHIYIREERPPTRTQPRRTRGLVAGHLAHVRATLSGRPQARVRTLTDVCGTGPKSSTDLYWLERGRHMVHRTGSLVARPVAYDSRRNAISAKGAMPIRVNEHKRSISLA